MKTIIAHICQVLACAPEEVTGLQPLDLGLTNSSYVFTCQGEEYVYRQPGKGTDAIINRQAEARAQEIAQSLGLDNTFVFEDPEQGWKISRYLGNCQEFDYANPEQVAQALSMIRTLHTSGASMEWSFDYQKESEKILALLQESRYEILEDCNHLYDIASALWKYTAQEDEEPVLCHNDFYGPNLLVQDGQMALIDWEYSAMGDYAADLGSFFAQGSGYTPEQACAMLPQYFGQAPSHSQLCHCMAYTAIVGFYWYVWAMYKDSQGNHPGVWMEIWKNSTQEFGDFALRLYEGQDR